MVSSVVQTRSQDPTFKVKGRRKVARNKHYALQQGNLPSKRLRKPKRQKRDKAEEEKGVEKPSDQVMDAAADEGVIGEEQDAEIEEEEQPQVEAKSATVVFEIGPSDDPDGGLKLYADTEANTDGSARPSAKFTVALPPHMNATDTDFMNLIKRVEAKLSANHGMVYERLISSTERGVRLLFSPPVSGDPSRDIVEADMSLRETLKNIGDGAPRETVQDLKDKVSLIKQDEVSQAIQVKPLSSTTVDEEEPEAQIQTLHDVIQSTGEVMLNLGNAITPAGSTQKLSDYKLSWDAAPTPQGMIEDIVTPSTVRAQRNAGVRSFLDGASQNGSLQQDPKPPTQPFAGARGRFRDHMIMNKTDWEKPTKLLRPNNAFQDALLTMADYPQNKGEFRHNAGLLPTHSGFIFGNPSRPHNNFFT